MTIKTTADGDSVTTETMADRLRLVQGEPWRKMRYTDENEEAAWDVYNESMFLRPGDGKAAEGMTELEGVVPRFEARWDEKKLLEAVSEIVKPEDKKEEVKEEPVKKPVAATETRKPTRTRGGSASAAAPRRGGRARAASSKAGSSTVNVD